MYCEEGQCEFNGLMEALKATEAENARLRAALEIAREALQEAANVFGDEGYFRRSEGMEDALHRMNAAYQQSPPQAFVEAKKERDAGWPDE